MSPPPKAPILLVDDRPENLLSLAAVLESLDQKLVQAASGSEALKRVLEEDFAVILLDVMMPDLDGFETAQLIRDRPRSQHTPLIFLTAGGEREADVARAYALGAVDFIRKPFDPDALRAKVRTFVDLSRDIQGSRRESAAYQAAILESALDAIITIDHEGRVVEWNPAAERTFGYPRADAVGRPMAELIIPPPARDLHYRGLARYLITGEPSILGRRVEMTAVRADGSELPVEISVTRVPIDGPPLFTGYVRDITERKRAEQDLRASGERLRAIARHARCILWDADVEDRGGRFLHWALRVADEEAAQRFFPLQVPPGRTYGQEFANSRLPEDVVQMDVYGEEEARAGRSYSQEFRCRRKDGAIRWMREDVEIEVLSPTRRRAVGVCMDITERKLVEEALQQSSQQLRLIIDAIPALIAYIDRDQRYRLNNRAYGEWFGHPHAALEGQPIREVLGEAAYERVRPHLDAALAGQIVVWEDWLPYRFGGPRYVRVVYVPDVGEQGMVLGVVLLVHDLTERKQDEEAAAFLAQASAVLASSLDYHRTLQSLAELAVPRLADWCVVDLVADDGDLQRVALVHRDPERLALAAEARSRYPAKPDFAFGPARVVRTGEAQLVREVDGETLEGAVHDEGHRALLAQLGLTSYMCVPLPARGRTLGALTFCAAESGRHYGEKELALAEDLARRAAVAIDNARLYEESEERDRLKDEFLAMLGHELRNPLAAISNAMQLARLRGAAGPGLQRPMEILERQTRNMGRLVDDLLDVARVTQGKIALRRERVDLAALAARAVEDSLPLMKARGHQLSVDTGPEPCFVEADPTRLEQVLVNLLTNAARFTSPGGQVWLDVSVEGAGTREVGGWRVEGGETGLPNRTDRTEQSDPSDPSPSTLHPPRSTLPTARISVRDTGEGIAPSLLPRIFEPFTQSQRSLDRASGGLGLGLALVKNIIEFHGGTVEARSEGPGRGSEFIVRLPALPTGDGETASSISEAPETAVRPLRLLLVEDEADAAETLAEMLRWMGHEVGTAPDGPTALALAPGFRPDVVLLDIGMPGMDGYELARRLRQQEAFRHTLLVALTGYGLETDRRRSREAGIDHHLVKPVDLAELQSLLLVERAMAPQSAETPGDCPRS